MAGLHVSRPHTIKRPPTPDGGAQVGAVAPPAVGLCLAMATSWPWNSPARVAKGPSPALGRLDSWAARPLPFVATPRASLGTWGAVTVCPQWLVHTHCRRRGQIHRRTPATESAGLQQRRAQQRQRQDRPRRRAGTGRSHTTRPWSGGSCVALRAGREGWQGRRTPGRSPRSLCALSVLHQA